MKNTFYLFILILISCKSLKTIKVDFSTLPVLEQREKSVIMGQVPISEKYPYTLDTLHPDHTPPRKIRVNFHFVNSSQRIHNFKEDSARTFVYSLLRAMQLLFDKNDKMRLPHTNDIPVIPVNIQYVLFPQKGDDGIYFHYDDDLVFYNHMGFYRNNGDYTVVEKYGIGIDSIINFFIMPHHPDSMQSKTYQKGCVGIALGNAVKVAGVYENKLNAMNIRGTFNHEVGHVLGLYHAWEDDGCDDTPRHTNKCWADAVPGCEGKTSNNMMDYNAFQSALTPCQLDIMHTNLSNLNHYNRKLLINTWCTYNPYKKIIISDSVLWSYDRDLDTDIEIKPNATLKVKCRVSMAPGSKISIHPFGKLILEDGVLHNNCSKTWQGIELLQKGKHTGEIIRMKNVVIKDVVAN